MGCYDQLGYFVIIDKQWGIGASGAGVVLTFDPSSDDVIIQQCHTNDDDENDDNDDDHDDDDDEYDDNDEPKPQTDLRDSQTK